MDDYGFIDYKQPVGAQNDYRTSTYRGHIPLVEQMPTKKVADLKNVCKEYPREGKEKKRSMSEHQDQYGWKPVDPEIVRNPTINSVQFIKPFEESHFRHGTKAMRPVSSVFNQDYKWKSIAYDEKPSELLLLSAVESTNNLLINRGEEGYAKLLDTSATTSNLAYIPYTTQQLRIASKDNITFWNWNKQKNNVFKTKQTLCNVFKSNDCPKRRREYHSLCRPVPNSGMTTQSASTYVKHLNTINFDITDIKNKLVSSTCPSIKAETENKMYGSGTPIQKYIN